jgi:hypothetical protein
LRSCPEQQQQQQQHPIKDFASSDEEITGNDMDRKEEFFDEEEVDTGSNLGTTLSGDKEICETWPDGGDSFVFLTELSGLQHLAVRQLAALSLHPLMEKYYTLNELLAIIDTPRVSIWSKMIGAIRPQKKRKGIFFCEVLFIEVEVYI